MNWRTAEGESGVGQVVEEFTDDSGVFRFFDPLNWEILIKMLDGCSNQRTHVGAGRFDDRFWGTGSWSPTRSPASRGLK